MSLLLELLPVVLTRARAGQSYERGERYWRQGRIVKYEVDGDRISGFVAGAEDYHVTLNALKKQLVCTCSCPVGGSLCKHVVALALHHLAMVDGAESRRAIPIGEKCFATDDELEQWCADHRVGFELETSAEVLTGALVRIYPSEWHLRRVLCTKSLGDVGSLAGAQRSWDDPRLVQATAVAAAQHLERIASEVDAGLAEERAYKIIEWKTTDPDAPLPPVPEPTKRRESRMGVRALPPMETTDTSWSGADSYELEPSRASELTPRAPSHPSIAPAWQQLVTLRSRLREGAMPRGRTIRAAGTWKFERDGATIEWHEATPVRGINYMVMPVISRLAFRQTAEITCTCKREPCTHAIALIDATLDRFSDPARSDEMRLIAEELVRPPWQRALAELAFVDETPKPKAAIELWWQVEHELREFNIAPIVKKQLKKGGTSGGTRITLARLVAEHGNRLDERDRLVVDALQGWHPGYGASYPVKAFAALVDHPRVMFEGLQVALKRFALGFTAIEAGAQIRLEPTVDGARFSPRLLSPLLQTFPAGEPIILVDREHDRVVMIDVGDDARRMWHALEKHGDLFPPESHGQLIERLARIEGRVPIAVAPKLMGDLLHEPATVVLRLRVSAVATLELEAFIRPARGAPLFPPGVGPREVMVLRDGVRAYAKRVHDREIADVAKALATLPLQDAEEGPPGVHRVNDPDTSLAIVAALEDPPDGIEAEWLDERPRVLSSPGVQHLKVQIEQKRDWFGITGQLKVEAGRVELAVLLDAARRQQRFVRLDANRWIELSKLLRDRLTELADRAYEGQTSKGIELSIGAVPIVQKLVDAGADVTIDETWKLLSQKLAVATKLKPKPPATLEATLRTYQIEGHAWLARLAAWGAGAVLADDMGLGKTVQAIAILLDRAKLGPAIVLAPTTVALNWVDELKRFAPTLRPVVYGAGDRGATLRALTKKDVLIVSYGLLARDAEMMSQVAFSTLIADEAQALKNPRTERAKAARMLKAEFKVAMSGTPLENHLGELWSLFALVFPGLLGSWDQFRARFGVPIEVNRSDEARGALARVIKPFLLRRTKAEVAPELPARTEIMVPIALSSEEAELYEDARLAAVSQLDKTKKSGPSSNDEKQRFEILAALTRMRLLASHPKLYDPTSSVASSKMQRLLELVDELRSEGHRALVFSQFTSHLSLVRAELDRQSISYHYFDGTTAQKQRAELVKKFQAGEGDLFLISLKAGGTGINLTGADYVIHLDPWWNPAVEDQATDRAHRIGQDKPVTVYRLVARGTVEEKILALHTGKRALVAGVLDGTDAAAKLTSRDLIDLLA